MTRHIKKINPLQLGKFLGIICGLGTFAFSMLVLCFAALAYITPNSPLLPMMDGIEHAMQGTMLAKFGPVAPIFYGIIGFITGVIGAFIYNLVAKWSGGIEIEVE